MPLRGQVVFSVKHLFCGNVKTITCIVDEVLVEEVVQSVQLLMTLRIGMSQIWRVMRTFKKTFSTEKFLLKDFPQFLSVPDAKRDPGNMPKEWRRFHKDSWVFNRVTIPFPNSHFAISSSAGIVNYSMSSHEKKFAQTFTLIFPPQQANVGL